MIKWVVASRCGAAVHGVGAAAVGREPAGGIETSCSGAEVPCIEDCVAVGASVHRVRVMRHGASRTVRAGGISASAYIRAMCNASITRLRWVVNFIIGPSCW
jgi:hypothetical protein